jgi:hypothetical protein
LIAAVAVSEGNVPNSLWDLTTITDRKLSIVGLRGQWEGPGEVDKIFSEFASSGIQVAVLYADLYSNKTGYANREDTRLWANLRYYLDKAHEFKLRILVYFSATQAYGYTNASWMQMSGSSRLSDFLCPTSPYGDFAVEQTGRIIRAGADGMFLDTLYLRSQSCTEPGGADTLQQYGYEMIHAYAERFYMQIKDVNPNALLIINNNNILDESDRDRYALDIGRLQDVADGFLLEFIGINSVTASDVERSLSFERYQNHNVMPLWVLAYTTSRDEYQRLISVVGKYSPSGLWVQGAWYTRRLTAEAQLLLASCIAALAVLSVAALALRRSPRRLMNSPRVDNASGQHDSSRRPRCMLGRS